MHQNKNTNQHTHIPVMLDEVLHYLDPKSGEKYLDLTAGRGGHASAILERTLEKAKPAKTGQAILVDRDESAVDFVRSLFEGRGVRVIQKDYLAAAQELVREGSTFDLMLADLGVSSPHLSSVSRGFSFQQEASLDMRMDQSQELTAATIVNNYGQAELADILRKYGEEPKAHAIARMIVERRPIETTTELAAIVARAWPGHSKVHPATRTFQALRIAVNNEIELLKAALPLWIDLLAPGGRLVVLSFHSLEDRIVKQTFAESSGNRYDARVQLQTKRPILPKPSEVFSNPRARSAKLRAACKK